MEDRRICRIEGRALPMRGHDIDTDRIIPARFLRSVRFEGLEAHVFEDDRASWPAGAGPHPFDNPAYAGAAILVVNRNFGCGSSREHAPQAISRWGIRAIVGESFSEIFFGNSLALGLPCLTVSAEDAEFLLGLVEREPQARLTVDVERRQVATAARSIGARLPDAAHEAFVTGNWDATGLLLDNFGEVEAVARRVPYIGGF